MLLLDPTSGICQSHTFVCSAHARAACMFTKVRVQKIIKTNLVPGHYCDLGTRQCNKMSIHYSSYVDESRESVLLIVSS